MQTINYAEQNSFKNNKFLISFFLILFLSLSLWTSLAHAEADDTCQQFGGSLNCQRNHLKWSASSGVDTFSVSDLASAITQVYPDYFGGNISSVRSLPHNLSDTSKNYIVWYPGLGIDSYNLPAQINAYFHFINNYNVANPAPSLMDEGDAYFGAINGYYEKQCGAGLQFLAGTGTPFPRNSPLIGTSVITPLGGKNPIDNYCIAPPRPKQCPSTDHPCSITSGNKFKPQLDWKANVGPLQFNRNYNSLGSAYNAILGGAANAAPFGRVWTHNYNLQLLFSQNTDTPQTVVLMRPNGLNIDATNIYTDTTIAGTGGWFISRDASLKLNQLSDGTWQVINIKSNTIESYDANGRLTKISYQNGQFVTVAYPATVAATSTTAAVISYNPTTVTDNFGQVLTFTYNAMGYLTSVLLPSGQSIVYTYDASNRLSTVARPGYGTKTYLYSENSTIAPSGNPNLLTGIIDEKGTRFESYAYDSSDRGISTSMAGGVENYTLNYTANGYNAVTDPHGLTKNYYITNASGSPVVGTSVLMQGGSATLQEHNYTYDNAGNIASDTHFGVLTNYTYDLTRNLETSRTEAVGTPQQRTITTQYDPVLPVPVLITEQGRTTAFTYDATGNVLTKVITDTTTNTSRTWTYTYNSIGQKLTETNPAGEKTTYSYDTSGHLLTVTNSLGFVTTYSSYTALGQPGLITAANGLTTTYTYDDAGRVLTSAVAVSTAGYPAVGSNSKISHLSHEIVKFLKWLFKLLGLQDPFSPKSGSTSIDTVSSTPLPSGTTTRTDTTTYSYDPIGQLTQVQMPSGEVLSYTYDGAHRLIGATDSLGNSISYTLNGAGDITSTVSQDPTGNIKIQTQQVFDTLGRVQQDLGNNGQSTTYAYDNLNNLTGTTDALSRHTNSGYDALKHKTSDIDALGGTTQYSYNALDQLLTITDARHNTTSYQPNAFGENVQETSPDTGVTTRTYSNGRLATIVDSRSITHGYSYDNLGRMLTRTDGTGPGQLITTYGYDAGTYGKGYLTSITTSTIGTNGVSSITTTTNYVRDSLGNISQKSVSVLGGQALPVQYQYLSDNKISDIMLPSGERITYHYTVGKVTSVTNDSGTLISNVKYGPTGVVSWTWGTGSDTNVFSTDIDGRLTGVTSTGVLGRSYAYDAGNRILNINDILAGIGTQTYTHDNLDRLIQQNLNNQTLGYSYDLNSNRTSKAKTVQGTTTQTNYVIQGSTNRIDATTTGSNGALTSTYLPTGQLVSDGVRAYNYDNAGRSSTISQNSITMNNLYDGLGQRVRKSSSNVPTKFMYDEQGHLIGEYDQNNAMIREYIWLGDRIIGMYSKDAPNILLRVHTDHLGTPRAVSMEDGSNRRVLWRFEGDAFGDVQPTNPTSAAFTMPLRMAGQYNDAEVGVSYNYFRDYDPSTGRYVESDPIGLQGGLNTYGYVGGNPLSWADERGLFFGLDDAAEVALASTAINAIGALWLESRGNYHPTLPIVKPGRDCHGNCKPCPPGQQPWREANHAAGGHGSTTGFHWHRILYKQNIKDPDCVCYPKKEDSPDGINWD